MRNGRNGQAAGAVAAKPRKGKPLKGSQGKIAALFLLPYMLIFTIFRLGPSVAGIYISFCKWDLAGSLSFVGLKNFSRLLTDQYFHTSLINTLIFFVLTLLFWAIAFLCETLCFLQLITTRRGGSCLVFSASPPPANLAPTANAGGPYTGRASAPRFQ